jgi:hypothetical protein
MVQALRTICHARCCTPCYCPSNSVPGWTWTRSDMLTAVVQYDYSSKFCMELPLTFSPQLILSTVSCCGTPTTILSHAQMHLLFRDWVHISLIQQCLTVLWFISLCYVYSEAIKYPVNTTTLVHWKAYGNFTLQFALSHKVVSTQAEICGSN